MKKIVKINVDFNNLKSIAKADRKKSRLENEGYVQISMKPYGYDKFILVYQKT